MPQSQDKIDFWKLHGLRIWTIIGAGVIIVAFLKLCGMMWQGVAVIISTALIVFLLHGVVNRLAKLGLPRAAATVITLVVAIVIVVGAFAIFVPQMVAQLTDLINNMPGYINDLRDFAISYANSDSTMLTMDQLYQVLDHAQEWFSESSGEILSGVAGGVVGIGIGVGNFFLIAFISILASLWILIDLPKISQEFMGLFNAERQSVLRVIGNAFGDAIYGWSKATIVCAVLKGLLVGIAYTIAGVPYASILGFVCGILYIIPYIGPLLGYVISGVAGLTVSLPLLLIAVVLNVIIQELVAQLVSPRLMKSSVNVHPAIILIVLIVGEGLGGILGMLAAIPVMAAVQTIFVTFYEARTGKQLYSEDGALFHKDKEKTPIRKAAQSASDTLTNLKMPKGKH